MTKTLFVLAFLLSTASAASACDISKLKAGEDYQAAELQKWTAAGETENFCKARSLIKKVKDPSQDSSPVTLEDLPVRMSRFVTPEEYNRKVKDIVAEVLAKGFSSMLA